MNKVDLQFLKTKIEFNLNLQAVSSKAILDRFCMIDEFSRKSAAYTASNYLPFYYHLGKYVEPYSLMEVGFNLGLPSCSFLLSCKTVQKFLAFREADSSLNPFRIGKSNIKLVYKNESAYYHGKFHDEQFYEIFSPNPPNLYDLIILNYESLYDKHLECLDVIWPQVSEHGLIVADYLDKHSPAKEAFVAFCESKNRKPMMFNTRYGVGILQK